MDLLIKYYPVVIIPEYNVLDSLNLVHIIISRDQHYRYNYVINYYHLILLKLEPYVVIIYLTRNCITIEHTVGIKLLISKPLISTHFYELNILHLNWYFSLGAIHPDAYEAYQTSHNLKAVVEKMCSYDSSKAVNNKNDKKNIKLSLLTPILPMLVSFSLFNFVFGFHIAL